MRICQSLFHSSQPCLHFLPNTWLNEMLNTVSSTSSVTSVTRRRFVWAPALLVLEKVVINTNLLERINLSIREVQWFIFAAAWSDQVPHQDGMVVLSCHVLFSGRPTNSHVPLDISTYKKTHIIGTRLQLRPLSLDYHTFIIQTV